MIENIHEKEGLLLAGENADLRVTGMSATSDGRVLLCDFMNNAVKEWRPASPPRILYRSDWQLCSLKTLQDSKQIALLETKPVHTSQKSLSSRLFGAFSLKNYTFTTRVMVAQINQNNLFIPGLSVTFDENTSWKWGNVDQPNSGHLFCSFSGFHKVHEVEIGQRLKLLKAHQMPSQIRCSALAKVGDKEILYVGLYDDTIRGFQVSHVGVRGSELTQLNSTEVERPVKLLYLPEQSLLLVCCRAAGRKAHSLQVYKQSPSLTQLNHLGIAVSPEMGFSIFSVCQISDKKILIFEKNQRKLMELNLSQFT